MLKNIFEISNKLLLSLCVLSLTILVLITVIDVFGRYLLGSPLPGTTEITEIILGLLIYIGLPYICRNEEHVSVSLFSNYLNKSFLKVQKVLVNLTVFILLCIIAAQLYRHGIDLYSYNEITTYLEIPKAPIAFSMALLTMLAAVSTLLNCYEYLFNQKLLIKNE
tara:strand:+ start:60 stop:554 length:495 start_codon:yes stop_codon:yes gene_type:complete